MYWLKRCPRCAGDLFEEQDVFGQFVSCLQCGYSLTVEEEAALRGGKRLRHIETTAPERVLAAVGQR